MTTEQREQAARDVRGRLARLAARLEPASIDTRISRSGAKHEIGVILDLLSANQLASQRPEVREAGCPHHPLCSIWTGKQGFRCDYDCGRDFPEILCRALCVADHENPDEDVSRHNGDFMPRTPDGKRWQRYRAQAEAAMALMPIPATPKSAPAVTGGEEANGWKSLHDQARGEARAWKSFYDEMATAAGELKAAIRPQLDAMEYANHADVRKAFNNIAAVAGNALDHLQGKSAPSTGGDVVLREALMAAADALNLEGEKHNCPAALAAAADARAALSTAPQAPTPGYVLVPRKYVQHLPVCNLKMRTGDPCECGLNLPGTACAPQAPTASQRAGVERRFNLRWIAGARPPVHPELMHGRQSFDSFEDAIAFFGRKASDAQFTSLTEIETRKFDRSDDARAAIAALSTAEGAE